MKLFRWLFVLTTVFVSSLGLAQTQPNMDDGFKPYGSYDGSSLDSVDLHDGNLLLHAPLIHTFPQRGGRLDIKVPLYVSSHNWTSKCAATDPITGAPGNCYWVYGGTGVSFQFTPTMVVHREVVITSDPNTPTTKDVNSYSLTSWDGGTHSLADISGNMTGFQSMDGTGYQLSVSNPDQYGVPQNFILMDRAGNQYQGNFGGGTCSKPSTIPHWQPGGYAYLYDNYTSGPQTCEQRSITTQLIDANGNQVALGSQLLGSAPPTDTMGRPVWPFQNNQTGLADASGCGGNLPFASSALMTYTGLNGGNYQVKVCLGTINLQTNFGIPNMAEVQNSGGYSGNTNPTSIQAITTVILADGTKWVLNYDSYGYATSIALPTGGSISYAYTTITPALTPCSFQSAERIIASRTLTDIQGHSSTWTYHWGTRQSNNALTNWVTDPLGNDIVHAFTPVVGNCHVLETTTQYYQGSKTSGKLLKQVDTTFGIAKAVSTIQGGIANAVVTDVKTTVYPSGKVNLVHKNYDSGIAGSGYTMGDVTAEKSYDWGQGAPGALLRETDTTYQWQTDSTGAYLHANLVDLPASVVVKDGSGNRMAETDYAYDEASYLTAANIASQHGAAPGAVRGNLTTVSKWLNTSNSFITSHTNWYDTGEVYRQIDPLGHTTTHSYDAAYQGAYSTQTCNALSQCVSGTYDFTTGLMASFTDANATTQASGTIQGDSAHTTNYVWDLMERMQSATLPPDPQGSRAVTSVNYPDPNQVEVFKDILAGVRDHSFTFQDGLGRNVKTQHVTPDGTATVDTTYDGDGHTATISNPYYSTTETTYGITQSSYDALGRVTQSTKQDGSASFAAYNVATSTGGPGDCSTSTDEAGKQRGSCTDALGRLIEVDEPSGNPVQAQNYVTLQSDGNFVVYNPAGSALWSTGTSGTNASSIFMQDDGNLVLYMFRWSAGTYATPTAGSYPVSTCSIGTYLVAGQTLPSGKCITSPHGQYFLLMNTDGNLFIYDWAHATGTWGPGTQGHPGAYAVMQGDGNFCVYAANGAFLWCSGTSGTYAERLNLEDDGRIIIYKSAWNSGTSNGQFTGPTMIHPSCDIGLGTGTTGVVGPGKCLVSPNGRFEMLMQTDGNLAIYDRSVNPPAGLWSTGTNLSAVDPSVAMRTLYSYDALGNLLCVEQHGNAATGTGCSAPASSDATSPWRVRRFTYDSLSRLLTATNPESGQISYSYDADGNLLQKTSPAPNQTGTATQTINYCYDALHRMVAKAYGALSCPIAPGSAVVSYVYDLGTNGIGHLSSLTDQAGTASYAYDVLGRLSNEQRTINGISKSLSYAYNLNGSLKSLTYPSGATVIYTPDAAGRMLSAVDTVNNINYVTGATYNATTALTGFVSGHSNSFNGITNSFSFNKRLQPINMSASAPSQTVFSIGYDFHLGNGNNGNVYGITNYKDANRNQTFTYDAMNRLASAQNAGTDCTVKLPDGHTEYWGNSYSYDAWGNLTQKTVTKCSAENMNITADSHNWIHTLTGADYTYDAAGNMTYNATSAQGYTFDQENRITALSGYTYTYDGDGNRVMKSTTVTPSTGTLYWYMTPGIVAESDLAGAIKSEYVFFDGERVARRDNGLAVSYYFSDHLKTAAIETDASGNIKDESDFYPWGGELQFASSNDNHYKFTGKERDSESGLDYFGKRFYSNGLGRWTSADPKGIALRHLLNPQKLNKYSYVLNTPTGAFDPDGMEEVTIQFRALIQKESVGGFKGDNRGFSADPKASSRVSVTVKIETDPAKNHGNPMIGSPQVDVGKTHPIIGGEKTSSGPKMPEVKATQDKNGNVTVKIQESMRNPYTPPGTGSVRSDVNITVNQDATKAEVSGTVSGSPSFEANFSVDGSANQNLPLQTEPSSTLGFIWGLQKDNQIDKKTDLPKPAKKEDEK
jgi:RHS repeat-associated protein